MVKYYFLKFLITCREFLRNTFCGSHLKCIVLMLIISTPVVRAYQNVTVVTEMALTHRFEIISCYFPDGSVSFCASVLSSYDGSSEWTCGV